MIEITWRCDPTAPDADRQPATPAAAAALLSDGNAAFAGLQPPGADDARLVIPITADDLGFGATPGTAPPQAPFAALLGCADARVPLELVFLQSANDTFTVRVAGNVLGSECVGSIDYAIGHLPSLRLLAVVGHTGCGAVSSAVDAYLAPATYLGMSANLPLRNIVDAVMGAVRGADEALHAHHGDRVVEQPGYATALTDTAVVLNAAVAADAVRRIFATHLGDTLGVAFGVYDLASRQVGLPDPAASDLHAAWRPGLVAPPTGDEAEAFVRGLVALPYVAHLLATSPAAHH